MVYFIEGQFVRRELIIKTFPIKIQFQFLLFQSRFTMGSYLLIVSVCSLLLTLNAVTARPSSHKLDRVFIVLRHGHRSPMHWYPTHPKAPETTGKFLHKLTPLGEEMATQQGLRMKKIYKELLGVDRILPEWVESFTSNTSRTNRTGVRFLNAFTDSSDSRLTTLPTLSDFVSILSELE